MVAGPEGGNYTTAVTGLNEPEMSSSRAPGVLPADGPGPARPGSRTPGGRSKARVRAAR
jgi:hypothetical protein